MLASDMRNLRNQLETDGILFCYSGYLTEEILTGIGNAIKKKLELEETDKKTARGLFSIFVEQVQNVIRYSSEGVAADDKDDGANLRFGLLAVGESNGKFFVSCANTVNSSDVERLTGQLEHIQSLDRESLMKLYKDILRGETPEGSKGAGVGFVDIARRATHGFEFDFMALDDTHSYFCLKAYV